MAAEKTPPGSATLKLCLDLLSGPCSWVSQSSAPYLSEPQPHLAYEHGFPRTEVTEEEAGLHFSVP